MTIVGPLFWKELLETARRKRYFAARVVVAMALLVALWGMAQPLRATQVAELAALGRTLLERWAWVQLIALVIFVPAFASGLVAGEKDSKTIDALFTSDLSDAEILWGKLASRLWLTLAIVGSSVPVIILLTFLGGFGPREVVNYAVIHVATAIFAAAVGIYYSVISSKPYVALIRAYFALLVVWLVAPVAASAARYLMPGGGRWIPIFAEELFAWINPFEMMTDASVTTRTGWTSWVEPSVVHAAVVLTAAALVLVRSYRLLRRAANWSHTPLLWRLVTRAFRATVYGATTVVERRRERGGWRRLWAWELRSRRWNWERNHGLEINPLFFRRATANVYDPERYVAGLQTLGWVVVVGYFLAGGYFAPGLLGNASNYGKLLWIELPMLAAVLVILAATSIARERERGSLDLLLLTSLTPRQFLVGTNWGVFRTAWPSILLVILTLCFGALASLRDNVILVWAFTFPPMVASIMAGSILISVAARRPAAAVAAALVPPIFFAGGVELLDGVRMLHGGSFGWALVGATLVGVCVGFMRPRRSLLSAVVLAIGVPLGCSLMLLSVADLASGVTFAFQQPAAYQYWRQVEPSVWEKMNYARWLLGDMNPTFALQRSPYGDTSVLAVAFGVAHLAAAMTLNLITAGHLKTMLGLRTLVLTPHPGEFAKWIGERSLPLSRWEYEPPPSLPVPLQSQPAAAARLLTNPVTAAKSAEGADTQ